MILRLLGTGAAEGIPAFLCNCRVCLTARRRRGREVRQNACALVTAAAGASLLIDLPPHIKQTVDRRRVDEAALAAVLITHAHGDHCLGLHHMPDGAVSRNGYRDPRVVDLCVPASVLAFVERLAGAAPAAVEGDSPYRLRVACAYERFETGPFAVTPLETGHVTGGECFGYLIEEGGCALAYVLDSPSRLPQRTMQCLLARPLDCLVFDCTFNGTSDPGSHSNLAGLIAMHERLRPRLTVASHISHRCLDHRGLVRALRPHGILAAHDGMTLRLRDRRGGGD